MNKIKNIARITLILTVLMLFTSIFIPTALADDRYTTMSIKILWEDQNDIDGIRPNYVDVKWMQLGYDDIWGPRVWANNSYLRDDGIDIEDWEYKETVWNEAIIVWVDPAGIPEGYTLKEIDGDLVNGFTIKFAHTHVHSFTKKIPYGQYYLAKDRTCTNGYIWYYACNKCDAASETMDLTYEDGDPLGHNYGANSYTWNGLNTCTATRTCRRDGCNAKETETKEVTSRVTQIQSCTQPEITTYTADFANRYFVTQTKEIETAEALLHDWGETTYTWSSDNTTCTATRICQRDSCTDEDTETVNATANITQNKSCTLPELTTFTASFTNAVFMYQVKENIQTAEAINHNYIWNNNSTQHWEKCTLCQEKLTADNHTFGAWIVKIPSDNTQVGEEERTCTVCDYDDSRIIEVTYNIIEGNNQKVEQGNPASFVLDAPYVKFEKVQVDGNNLQPEKITVGENPTRVTLNAEYITDLAVGEHTITVVYADGEVSTKFTVNQADDILNSSATGDSSNILLWTILFTISVSVYMALYITKKHKV